MGLEALEGKVDGGGWGAQSTWGQKEVGWEALRCKGGMGVLGAQPCCMQTPQPWGESLLGGTLCCGSPKGLGGAILGGPSAASIPSATWVPVPIAPQGGPKSHRVGEEAVGHRGGPLLDAHHLLHVLEAGIAGHRVEEGRAVLLHHAYGVRDSVGRLGGTEAPALYEGVGGAELCCSVGPRWDGLGRRGYAGMHYGVSVGWSGGRGGSGPI